MWENEGHPEDNLEPGIHIRGGKLIDYVIHFHRGSKGHDAQERVSIESMHALRTMAKHGRRAAIVAALPVIGPLMDEGGLDSLIAYLTGEIS